MRETKDLVVALLKDDYKTAKEAVHGAVASIINQKIEAKKQEIRDNISNYSSDE